MPLHPRLFLLLLFIWFFLVFPSLLCLDHLFALTYIKLEANLANCCTWVDKGFDSSKTVNVQNQKERKQALLKRLEPYATHSPMLLSNLPPAPSRYTDGLLPFRKPNPGFSAGKQGGFVLTPSLICFQGPFFLTPKLGIEL